MLNLAFIGSWGENGAPAFSFVAFVERVMEPLACLTAFRGDGECVNGNAITIPPTQSIAAIEYVNRVGAAGTGSL